MTDIRYPIGKFTMTGTTTLDERSQWIEELAKAPEELRSAVRGLNAEQLNSCYREGGWTLRQVVHHLPDSHLNAYVRCKLALTEERPLVKTYEEALWAELSDSTDDIDMSLDLLDALHRRWVSLLRSLTQEQWQREYLHPEMKNVPLHRLVGLYAWHGKHHIAHIVKHREQMGW
ncbi:MAG: putative metal-dependent hydrolase [bacterium]|nr:putative metal-dependent hydrolase [bacterium]